MSECERLSSVGAYHDGQLPPEGRLAMQAHLEHCGQCAAELAALRRLSALLAGQPAPELSAHFMGRLRGTVVMAGWRSTRRLTAALTALAASVLVACTAWLFTASASGGTAEPAASSWEARAVLPAEATTAASTEEDRLAMWMVQELSTGER
jgi:anti-sigma factor RsiW